MFSNFTAMSLLSSLHKRALGQSDLAHTRQLEFDLIMLEINKLPLYTAAHKPGILKSGVPGLLINLKRLLTQIGISYLLKEHHFEKLVDMVNTCHYILSTCQKDLDVWFFCVALEEIISRKMLSEGIDLNHYSIVPSCYADFCFALNCVSLQTGRLLGRAKLHKEFGLEPNSIIYVSDTDNSESESDNSPGDEY